jgi:hypothetical protein
MRTTAKRRTSLWLAALLLPSLTCATHDEEDLGDASTSDLRWVQVSISPTAATVQPSTTSTFSATVSGTPYRAVSWSVSEPSCGRVSSAGVYTSPPSAAVCHVRATSVIDAPKSATAAVTVLANPPPLPLPPPPLPPPSSLSRTLLDPLPRTASGHVVEVPDDFGQRPAFVKDNHGAGDVVGLFFDAAVRRLQLFDVTTGRWYAAPTETLFGPGDSNNGSQSIAQDSAGKIHFVWASINLSSVAYSRAAPTRDASGHVIGFTWEADALAGPAIGLGDWRLHLIDALDQGGTEGLVLGLGDASQDYGVYALARAATLAPVGAPSWKALDGSPGRTLVLRETASDTYTAYDGSQLPVTALAAPIHQSEMAVAQHPVDRSIHVFLGARLVEGGPGTDVRRFRFAPSGPATWALDPAANGLRLARNAVNDRTYLGSVAVSRDRIWLAYFDPNAGLRVVHSENGYGVDSGVPLPLAYATDDGAGQTACGLSASLDNRLWIAWEQDFLALAKSAYWNGSRWDVANAGVPIAYLQSSWAWGGYAAGERDGLTSLAAWNTTGKYQPFVVSIHGGE